METENDHATIASPANAPLPPNNRWRSRWSSVATGAIYLGIAAFFFFRLELLCGLDHELWRVRGANDYGRCGTTVMVHSLRHIVSGAPLAHYVELASEEDCGPPTGGASIRKRDREHGYSFHDAEKTAALVQIEVSSIRWQNRWGDVAGTLEEYLQDPTVSVWNNQTLADWLEQR